MRNLLVLFLFAISIMAQGKKITEEAMKNFCRDAGQAIASATTDAEKKTAFDAVAAKWGKEYDLQLITDKQVVDLFEAGGMTLDRYIRLWLEPTLTAKAEKDASFAFLAWKYMPENDGFMHSDKEITALLRFLNTQNLQGQLDAHSDYSSEVLNSLATMKDENWHTAQFPEAIERFMQCKLPELSVLECVKAFNSVARVDEIDNKYRESIRLACVKQYKQLLGTLDNQRKQKMCQEQIKYLEGPFACGKLVGGKAPALNIIRAFRQEGDSVATLAIKGLDDLAGKVVLIDFWGTKCVPCVQSFPEIAELQKHFEGKDVVILGVTSLQGYFVDTPNHRTVQCRNNPEKELGCFPAYMKAMGVNWTIAITEEDVMNTDFGVLAIPHVTIIDRQGRVRHNAVNADNQAKIQMIEQLLNE